MASMPAPYRRPAGRGHAALNFLARVRAGCRAAPILANELFASPMPDPSKVWPFESHGNTPLERAVAAQLVGDMNLLRLKAIARLLARGLAPEISWGDLLHEAFARVLNGSRRRPENVPVDVFMAGVMRSIRAEHWRRRRRALQPVAEATTVAAVRPARAEEARDPAPDPERALLAEQELAAIAALFAGDAVATQILAGICDGLSAEEIREECGLSKTEYDSARKRMRRRLLREGLKGEPL